MATSSKILIDVLSPDSFAAEHLPEAVNFCVYETAFIDKIREAFPDLAQPITVYGYDDSTREADLACEKLTAAGYTSVESLPGGLAGARKGGGEIVRGGGSSLESFSGRLDLDTANSWLHWTGQNLLNQHHGSLALRGGWVEMAGGVLTAGEVVIDMESLGCSDLTDSAMNRMLIEHLRSADFFSVVDHPLATFRIGSVEVLNGASPGNPSHRISGELELRGKSCPLSCVAIAGRTSEGAFVAQARLELDRTLWGSLYGSGKFFAKLGQHLVNDLVYVEMKILTQVP